MAAADASVSIVLVEREWQAMREWSMRLEPPAFTLHLVKGWVSPQVLRLMPRWPNSRVMSVPRAWFWPVCAAAIAWCHAWGTLRCIVVDNERSYARLRRRAERLGVSLMRIQPGAAGYELCEGEAPLQEDAWRIRVGLSCASS